MPINQPIQDVDFHHLWVPEIRSQPSIEAEPLLGMKKRKSAFGDGFSDVEIDEFELDEDDLKQLDRIQSAERLPNGKYKCNHLCKDRKKYTLILSCLDVTRCRHLCCKEGRVSTTTKLGVSASKPKKISSRHCNQSLSEIPSGKRKELYHPQRSVALRSSRAETQLGLSPTHGISSVGKPSSRREENPHSVHNSDLGDISGLIKVTISTPRYVSVNMADGIHDTREWPRSRRADTFKSLGASILRSGTSYTENDIVSGVSDDELPHPKDLLPKFRPNIGTVDNTAALSTAGLTTIDRGIENGKKGGEFNVDMRTSKLNDESIGFAFSIDDIFRCVEIVTT